MNLAAQDAPAADTWYYGFKAGVTYHNIQGIQRALIPEDYAAESYAVSEDYRIGFTGGMMFYHRFVENGKPSRFAVQPEILFASRGGDFNYSDVRDLTYLLRFNYQYLSLGTLVKVYPLRNTGLHLATGPQVAFNLAPDNLVYTSSLPELGPDLQIQQSLREVLTGGSDINLLLQLGYDYGWRTRSSTELSLMLEARYVVGLKDVIETRANGFDFIEVQNRTTGFQATLGFLIEFP